MSMKFGRQRSTSSASSKPLFNNTGFSNFKGRRFNLDPTIRATQDTASQNYASIYGDVGQATDRFITNTKSLRDRFMGNSGSFMESRLRPVRDRFNSLRSQVQQSLGARGLSGSTFQNQALTDVDRQAATAEGDAAAQANMELFAAEAGLNESELSALNDAAAKRAAITGETLEVARMRLAQEMGIFQLGNKQSQVGTSQSLSGEGKFKF